MGSLLLFMLMLTFGNSDAQISDLNYRTITKEDGLSMSVVLSIYRDSYGFMWFGCVKGLNRYDGRQITVFSSEKYPDNTLSDGPVTGICEGEKGKLYIAVYGGGLNIYDIKNNTFKFFKHSDDTVSLPDNEVNSVVFDGENTVWVGSDKGLSRFDPETETFTNVINSSVIYDDTVSTRILSLYDDDSVLWLGTYGKGLVRFAPVTGVSKTFSNRHVSGNDAFKKNIVRSITGFGDKKLLVATEEGLWVFDKEKEVFEYPLINGHSFYEIIKDDKGYYWATSFYNGLFRIDKSGDVKNIKHDPFDIHSLPSDQLYGAFYSGGTLWLGSLSNGVVQVDLDHKAFTHIYYVPGKPGIPTASVFSLGEDAEGRVWMGTPKGAAVWNREDDSFKNIRLITDGNKSSGTAVWNFFMDGDIVWICTPEGLIEYDPRSGRQKLFRNDPGNKNSIINNQVTFAMRDNKGDFWVATRKGACRMKKGSANFTGYVSTGKENSLSNSLVWQILHDTKGRLWFVTASGINRYNYDTDDFSPLLLPYADADAKKVHNPLSMVVDDRGRFWIGTNSGIVVYDEKTGTVKNIGTENGLPDLYIYKMLETKKAFWVSTNNGIAVIDKETLKVTDTYHAKDGLQYDEFNPAAIRLKDGYFLFGGVNGVSGFYPDSIHRSRYVPEIYFTGLYVSGKDVMSGENEKKFTKGDNAGSGILDLKKVYFDHDDRVFSFSFAALDYSDPSGIRYFYRMLPSTKEWISLGNKNYVNFVNLSSGKYRLEVKSTNSDGVMCDNAAHIDIVVKPPFWKTGWFVFAEVLLVILVVFLLMKLRTYRLKREKQKLEKEVAARTGELKNKNEQIEKQKEALEHFASDLEKKVKERTAELEKAKQKAEESDMLKSAFLSNMSHEIRTPMNAIMGFSELLVTPGFEEEERRSFARMVKANGDTLLTLLNDIIDISMIESGQLKLNLSDVDLFELVKNVFNTFSNSTLYREKKDEVRLLLKVAEEDRDVVIRTDYHRLLQILNNLVSNAIKFTSRGFVELGYSLDGSDVVFYVKDTGIGIGEAELKNIFKRFYKMQNGKTYFYPGNGLGLTITKNLVEALNGKIRVESKPGKGTVFYFTFSL